MLPSTLSLPQLFTVPVADKQHFAEVLHQKFAEDFLGQDDLRADLKQLQNFAGQVSRHMADLHMEKMCVRCAASGGGGCCSLFMAGETDAVQMLMNMLIGVTVSQVRDDGRECCYLGEKGCLFTFKPIFCLNYNCRSIRDAVSPENIAELERLTGQLLGKQYEVEKKLLELIGRRIISATKAT